MELNDLVLAVIPPALAILIELLSPFKERYFTRQTDAIFATEVGKASNTCADEVSWAVETAKKLHRDSMAGAAALVGVMPTCVSFAAGAGAMLIYVPNPWWWLGFVVFLIVVVLIVVRIVATRTVFELEILPVEIPRWPVKPTALFSKLVYATNIVLIGAAAAIYKGYIA